MTGRLMSRFSLQSHFSCSSSLRFNSPSFKFLYVVLLALKRVFIYNRMGFLMTKLNDFVFEPFSIGDVRFRNPFFVASGPTTRNLKQLMRAEECGWGAASIKLTIAPDPYINREPRYGWFENQGIFSFTTEKRLTPDQGPSRCWVRVRRNVSCR